MLKPTIDSQNKILHSKNSSNFLISIIDSFRVVKSMKSK